MQCQLPKLRISTYLIAGSLTVISTLLIFQSGKFDNILEALFWFTFYTVFSNLLAFNSIKIWQEQNNHQAWRLHTFIFSLALLVSGFWTLVFYPALMSYDSINQWTQALSGQYYSWHPPIMAMIMSLTILFSGNNPSLFAFIQGFLLWVSIYLVLHKLVRDNRLYLISCLIVTLLPSLWTYTSILWKDVWFASMALLGIYFLIYAIEAEAGVKRIKLLVSLIFFSLAIAFRHNGFTILLGLLVVFIKLFPQKNHWRNAILALCLAGICMAPAKIIDTLPMVQQTTQSPLLFASMYMGTLSRADITPSDLAQERLEIDAVFGDGLFAETFAYYQNGSCLFPIQSLLKFTNSFVIEREKLSFMAEKAVNTALKHPVAFLRHRLCNLAWVFYTRWELIGYTFLYYPTLQNNLLGLSSDSRLLSIKMWILDILKHSRFGFWSFIWLTSLFMVSGVVVSFLSLQKYPSIVITNAIGASYAFSYFLVDMSPDWRFLLSYVAY